MLKNYILTLFFLQSLTFTISAVNSVEDTLKIQGHFYDENLIVVNPMIDGRFAVTNLFVNTRLSLNEIRSSAFEIDFAAMGIKFGDTVSVMIIFDSEIGLPQILNPEAIKPKTVLKFINTEIDKKNLVISWTVEANTLTESFEIEHFRWDKWATVSVINAASDSTFSFSSQVIPHSGRNIFRIKYIDSEGTYFYSGEIKFTSKVPEVSLVSDKVKEKIEFSGETDFQLYNENGYMIMDGKGSEIDVTALEKGNYFLNFDNKTITVFKK